MLKDIFENRKVSKYRVIYDTRKEDFLCCFNKTRKVFEIQSNFIFKDEAIWDKLLTDYSKNIEINEDYYIDLDYKDKNNIQNIVAAYEILNLQDRRLVIYIVDEIFSRELVNRLSQLKGIIFQVEFKGKVRAVLEKVKKVVEYMDRDRKYIDEYDYMYEMVNSKGFLLETRDCISRSELVEIFGDSRNSMLQSLQSETFDQIEQQNTQNIYNNEFQVSYEFMKVLIDGKSNKSIEHSIQLMVELQDHKIGTIVLKNF